MKTTVEKERAMKRIETISTLHAQYTCTFRPEPEGGYQVRCPAFPGLITSGDTFEEARANALEALELCLEMHEGKGWPLIQEPKDEQTPAGIREGMEQAPARRVCPLV